MKHLVLFDGPCPLCHKAIHAIAKRDCKKEFYFSTLQGETAKRFELPPIDSLILVEDFEKTPRLFVEGKAVQRIAKLLGYRLFCPRWFYRLIARNRYTICKRPQDCASLRILP